MAHISNMRLQGCAAVNSSQRIPIMKLLTNLFSSDYGLMSLVVIAFVIFMSVWFYRFFKRHIEEDARKAGL